MDITTLLLVFMMIHITHGYTCHSGCICSKNFTHLSCSHLDSLQVSILPPHTKELLISHSNLGPEFNYSLSSLVELEFIDLSRNGIAEISGTTLHHLGRLKRLSLQGNRLYQLHNDIFLHTRNLEHLDLSQNSFSILPDVPFRFLNNLKVFNFSFNHLTSPVLGLRFQIMANLEVLDLSGNNFQNIPANTFEMSQNWNDRVTKFVNFSFCGIHGIEETAFSDMRKLKSLSLSGNNHLSIENLTGIFNATDISSLESLYLDNMSFENISVMLIALEMAPLKQLYISNNNIHILPEALSDYHPNLRVLVAHHNKITAIESQLTQILTLTHLDLSFNAISRVDTAFGEKLINLQTLLLSNNKIGNRMIQVSHMALLEILDLSQNEIDNFTIPNSLTNLQVLNISGNRIQELQPMIGLSSLVTFDISRNKLSTLDSFLFPDSTNIRSANFSGNVISKADHQTFRRNTPKVIDISHNKLEQISNIGWEDVEEIYLQQNSISEMDRNTFYGLFGLKVLDISHNKLTGFDSAGFVYLQNVTDLLMNGNWLSNGVSLRAALKAMTKLKWLDVSHNNYTFFAVDTLKKNKLLQSLKLNDNHILTIYPQLFDHLIHLMEIDLSNNHFLCDCELTDFRDWLRTTKINIIHRVNTTYTCHGPSDRKDVWITSYEVGKFECQQTLLYIIIFSSIGALVMLVCMISALVFRGYIKWRRNLKYNQQDHTIEYESMDGIPAGLEERKLARHNQSKPYMNGNISAGRSRDSLDYEVETLLRKEMKQTKLANGHMGIPLVGLAKVKKGTLHNKKQKKAKSTDDKSKKKKNSTGKKGKDTMRKNRLDEKELLKEVRFHNLRRDAQRYAEKMSRYRDGKNGLLISRMVPYFYDRHGIRHTTANVFRDSQMRKRHRDIQGHGDIVRIPESVTMGRPRHSHSVPDMLGYIDSMPRRRYPLNPEIHVVNHRDYEGRRYPRSADLLSASHKYSRSVGNLHPSVSEVQGHTHYQSARNLYNAKDALFLPARYEDIKYHTISAKPRSSKGQFGSKSEWI